MESDTSPQTHYFFLTYNILSWKEFQWVRIYLSSSATVIEPSNAKNVVPGLVSVPPVTMIKMQILGASSQPTESEILGASPSILKHAKVNNQWKESVATGKKL